MYRVPRAPISGDGFTQSMDIEDFRRRQEADRQRYADGEFVIRRRPFHERYEHLAKTTQDAYEDDEQAITTDDEDDDEPELLDNGNKPKAYEDEGEEACVHIRPRVKSIAR